MKKTTAELKADIAMSKHLIALGKRMETRKAEVFKFLDGLKEEGRVHGLQPYIMDKFFDLTANEAIALHAEWLSRVAE